MGDFGARNILGDEDKAYREILEKQKKKKSKLDHIDLIRQHLDELEKEIVEEEHRNV